MKTVTIEGEFWSCQMTPEEFAAWDIYATNTWLLSMMDYEPVLNMFLSHFRRGINLNNYYEKAKKQTAEV